MNINQLIAKTFNRLKFYGRLKFVYHAGRVEWKA